MIAAAPEIRSRLYMISVGWVERSVTHRFGFDGLRPDITTSHSTRLPKDGNQVAGYTAYTHPTCETEHCA